MNDLKTNFLTTLQKIEPRVDKKKLNYLLNDFFTFDEEKKQRIQQYYQRCGRVFDPGELHNTYAVNCVMGELEQLDLLSLGEKKELLCLMHIANGFSPKSIRNYKTEPVSEEIFDLFRRGNRDADERNRKFLFGVGLLLQFNYEQINALLVLLHPEGGIHFRDHCELIFTSFIGRKDLFPETWTDLDCFRELIWLTYVLQPESWRVSVQEDDQKLSHFKMKKALSNLQEDLTCHGINELWTQQIRKAFSRFAFDSIEAFSQKFLWYSRRYGFYRQTQRNLCIQDLIFLTDSEAMIPAHVYAAAVNYGIKKGILCQDEGEIFFQNDVNVHFGRFDLIYLLLLKKEARKTGPCEQTIIFGQMAHLPRYSVKLLPDIEFCIRKMNEAALSENWPVAEAMIQRGIADCEDIFALDEKHFCLAHFYSCRAELFLVTGHGEDYPETMIRAMALLMRPENYELLPALAVLGCSFLEKIKNQKWDRQISNFFLQLFRFLSEKTVGSEALFYGIGKCLREKAVISDGEKKEIAKEMEKAEKAYQKSLCNAVRQLMEETGFYSDYSSSVKGLYDLPLCLMEEKSPGYDEDPGALFLNILEDCKRCRENNKSESIQ